VVEELEDSVVVPRHPDNPRAHSSTGSKTMALVLSEHCFVGIIRYQCGIVYTQMYKQLG